MKVSDFRQRDDTYDSLQTLIETAQGLEALSSLGHLRILFLTIHTLGGLTGLPILILTHLFSPLTTPRQPTLVNFCITWALNSVAYTLT